MTSVAAPVPRGRSVSVKVPATTANLGPGFDTLGLALSLYDELVVTAVDRPGATVEVDGVGAGEVRLDEGNLVVRAIRHTLDRCGYDTPGLHVAARNAIPHGRGLGSSGAAIVAGVMAARGLLEGEVELDGERLLSIATELEGHPDNVAPALFGGLTIAWTTPTGPQHTRLMVHRGVSPLICVPEGRMSTVVSRGLRPASVPHEDATFNVSRSALLIAALIQSPELLLAATEDRLHQSYRAAAMPGTDSLITELRAHGLPAVLSGAGPSILVLCSDPAQRLEAAALVAATASPATASPATGATPWQSLMLAVDFRGATVNAHPTDAPAQPDAVGRIRGDQD